MYKLWNFLFGWDYVSWSNFADTGVSRIHLTPDGIAYYWRYRSTSFLDIVTEPSSVVWLTCHPSKYFDK